MYPAPKPVTRTVTLEIRAEQNGCQTCSGTGLVPGGTGWKRPGFMPCPRCGWKAAETPNEPPPGIGGA